jgi:methionyl-tRNA formyltransferase
MKKPFRIIFMGTPEFSVPSLERLCSDGHQVICSITQPDKKRGRGKKVTYSPVKEKSIELGLDVYQPEKIKRKETIDFVGSLKPDLLVTCAYGQILPEKLLEIPGYGCINVHSSLLPKYRGAAPIQRCILNGDEKTGITTMMTDAGMDTGDILMQSEVDIPHEMTAGELHDRLMMLGADVLSETLQMLANGKLKRTPQKDADASHAPMLKKEESIVNWLDDSFSIHNKVRAFDPWPGCFTEYNGKRMRITKSTFSRDVSSDAPGTLIYAGRNGLLVACGSGILTISGVQFENGRRMDISDCWHNFTAGEVFGKGK